MVKPERRTKGDVVAAVAIAAAVAIVAGLIWWTSDARATISRPAAEPAPTLAPAKAVPTSLRQLWTAPSPKTTTPVVVGGNVIAGNHAACHHHRSGGLRAVRGPQLPQ